MKKFTVTFAGLLAMGMLVLQLESPQQAKAQDVGGTGCNMTSVTGNYGFLMTGWNNTSGTTLPVATSGRLSFGGNGNIRGTSTTSVSGTLSQPAAMTGTYTINTDCTGAATFTDGGTSTVHIGLVVVNNGAQIFAIQTDGGSTVTGTAIRQGEGPH
jgi:hypothetical protein